MSVPVLQESVLAILAQRPRLRRSPIPTKPFANAVATTKTALARPENVLAADAPSRLD